MSMDLYLRAILRYQDLDTGEIVEKHDRFSERNISWSELQEVLSSDNPVETYLRILEPEMNVWYDEDEYECWMPYNTIDDVKPIVYYCWNPYLEHKQYLLDWLKQHEKRKVIWGMM